MVVTGVTVVMITVMAMFVARNVRLRGLGADETMMPVPVRRSAFALALVATLAVTGACSLRGSGYQYLRSRDTGTYVKVPDSWQVVSGKSSDALLFARAFDAEAVDADTLLIGERPSGLVRVRALADEQRYGLSFATMRQELMIDVDAGLESGQAQLLRREDLNMRGGFRGELIEFVIEDATEDGGDPVHIVQAAVVDAETTRVHVLALGCREPCFERYEHQIDAVVKSFTLRKA